MNKIELTEEIKFSMRSADNLRRDTLRTVLNEVKNKEIEQQSESDEKMVNNAIKKVLKQETEELDYATQLNNNQERIDMLTARIKILESLLPPMVAGEELQKIIVDIITENNFSSMKDTGKIMASLNKQINGCFNGSEAAAFIKEQFNG